MVNDFILQKILSGVLTLALVLTLSTPTFAMSTDAGDSVMVRQRAAALCGAYLSGDSILETDCGTEAYHRE